MNQEFLQKFIETNQPLTDKTIDLAVVKSLFEIKTVEDYLRSGLFKDSSKSKLMDALRMVREDDSPSPWFTRGNKHSLTIHGTKSRDDVGINYGYPKNHMLCYMLEPSGKLYLQYQLVEPLKDIRRALREKKLAGIHMHVGSSEF
tara:strand:+ start:171 stop:605 length:435 start_codon:yes stop_codon:yes gene_type:complete